VAHGFRRLSYPEIAGDEENDNNDTHNVKYIIHGSFSFHWRDHITVGPDAHNIMGGPASRDPSRVLVLDRARRQLQPSNSIRIGILHAVDALKPLLQVQTQPSLPLPISNDRLRTARPSMTMIQTVELDAPSVDFNLFRHGILLKVCCAVNVVS
jgi:hypothetical protein